MLSIETMKHRLMGRVGEEFPLVFWKGSGRIVDVNDTTIDLLVRGKRADFTWERVLSTWRRLLSNHTLTVDELGGGHDAVGLVSLFAVMQADGLTVLGDDGMLLLNDRDDRPVHQFVEVGRPSSWATLQRKIDGN
jgi:hypothetical protein